MTGANSAHALDEMIGLRRVNLGLSLKGPNNEAKFTAAKIRELHPIPEIEQALNSLIAEEYIPTWQLDALLELAQQKPVDNQFNSFKPSQHPDEFREAAVKACWWIANKPANHWPWVHDHDRMWQWLSRGVEKLVEHKVTILKSDYELLLEIREVLGPDENLEPLAGLSRHTREELCSALWILKKDREWRASWDQAMTELA